MIKNTTFPYLCVLGMEPRDSGTHCTVPNSISSLFGDKLSVAWADLQSVPLQP